MFMSENNNYNIGKRIKELRVRKGLSQEQLALMSNITTTYLGLLERNLKNPTIKVIEKICSSLNITISEFFSNDDSSSEPFDSLSLQIISQIENRKEEEKEIILSIIKKILKFRDLDNN